MPLIKSGSKPAFKSNVSEMVHAGHPVKQALAAAYRNAREHGGHFDRGGATPIRPDQTVRTPSELRSFQEILDIARPRDDSSMGKPFMPGYAPGGQVAPPWFVRNEARNMTHTGFIGSLVPGRTDKHNMSVAGGSYVVPADVISSIGEGNSLAGAHKFGQLLHSGPYGSAASPVPHSVRSIRQRFADGGDVDGGPPAEIVTAGGEYVVDPESVKRIGGGDLSHGHDILDNMVKHVRAQTIKKLKSLPPPKKKS